MGLFSFLSSNKKGPTYRYKTPAHQARAARALVSNLNTGKIDLGGRTYAPGAETMLPDENGVPVFLEYVGIVEGKARWKQPDWILGKVSGRGKVGEVGVGMGMDVSHASNLEPIDGPLNSGMDHRSRTGGHSVHSASAPVFEGGLGMGISGAQGPIFGGSLGTRDKHDHQSTRHSQHKLPHSLGQDPFNPHSPGYHQARPRGFGRHHSSPTRSSTRHSNPHTFNQRSSLSPPFSPPFQHAPQQRFQQPTQHLQTPLPPPPQAPQSQAQPALPPGVVDPLATVKEPLGKHGKRAYVPGQTQLQKKFLGNMMDPEKRYEYLAELEKLRKENERRGIR
ncbi:hypothetical protein NX059_001999 [Plenodomus lindquistii]|nr:hypothetical protein NX059_001999 [Plenodomus lindquistii]